MKGETLWAVAPQLRSALTVKVRGSVPCSAHSSLESLPEKRTFPTQSCSLGPTRVGCRGKTITKRDARNLPGLFKVSLLAMQRWEVLQCMMNVKPPLQFSPKVSWDADCSVILKWSVEVVICWPPQKSPIYFFYFTAVLLFRDWGVECVMCFIYS